MRSSEITEMKTVSHSGSYVFRKQWPARMHTIRGQPSACRNTGSLYSITMAPTPTPPRCAGQESRQPMRRGTATASSARTAQAAHTICSAGRLRCILLFCYGARCILLRCKTVEQKPLTTHLSKIPRNGHPSRPLVRKRAKNL